MERLPCTRAGQRELLSVVIIGRDCSTFALTQIVNATELLHHLLKYHHFLLTNTAKHVKNAVYTGFTRVLELLAKLAELRKVTEVSGRKHN
jgi:hypothetical protein